MKGFLTNVAEILFAIGVVKLLAYLIHRCIKGKDN